MTAMRTAGVGRTGIRVILCRDEGPSRAGLVDTAVRGAADNRRVTTTDADRSDDYATVHTTIYPGGAPPRCHTLSILMTLPVKVITNALSPMNSREVGWSRPPTTGGRPRP